MNVVYAIDKKVYKLALVSFVSLLKNNFDETINLYVLCQKKNISYAEKFNKLKNIKDFNLKIMEIDVKDFEELPIGWLTSETWFRIKLSEILPQLDRVLYLDCDTLIRKNISELYNRDMQDNDIIVRREDQLERIPYLNLQSGWYFNAGVMICNLENWRKHNLVNKLYDTAITKKEMLKFMDQDVFNIVCDNSKIPFNSGDIFLTWNSDGAESHSIVHFIGPKPTELNCVNKKYKKEWWEYAKFTPVYKFFIFDYVKKIINKIRNMIFSVQINSVKIIIYILGIKISFKRKKINA